jgi:hypothetical protein
MIPRGPRISPTSDHVGGIPPVDAVTATKKWPVGAEFVIYPSPTATPITGRDASSATAPVITIVPGFTPPIVVAAGRVNSPPSDEIGAVPT